MARWFPILLLSAWSAQAYSLRKDAAGDVVRWRGAANFVVDEASVGRWNVPGARDAIHAAIDTFAQATGTAVHVSARDGRARAIGVDLADASKSQNDIIVLFDWPYTDGALATTLVTYDAKSNQIVDADVLINAEQHEFGVLDVAHPQALSDVQAAVTHELGHALGLMHNDADEHAVMYPQLAPGDLRKRVLTADDEAGLSVLYDAEAAASPGLTTDAAVVAQGCSSASGAGVFALLSLAILALRRPERRPVRALARRARVAARWLPVLALAAAGSASAQDQAVVTVRATSSSLRGGLITTTLTLVPEGCRDCAATTVVVPGGRVGDLVQELVHHPVPVVDDRLVLIRRGGKLKLQRLARQPADAVLRREGQPDPSGAPATRAPLVQPLTSPPSVTGSAIEMENAHGPATTSDPDRR